MQREPVATVRVEPDGSPGFLRTDLALHDSPHRVPLPEAATCDVVVTAADLGADAGLLNDPGASVFCLEPGDYRGIGRVRLTASGSEAKRRILRVGVAGPAGPAIRQAQRALFEGFELDGASWWVIQGVTVEPTGPDPPARALFLIRGGDHNVVDGLLLDASKQPNQGFQRGLFIRSRQDDPATHNTLQASVLRSGNRSRSGQDFCGVCIGAGDRSSAHIDFNRIVDNEIYDWGDGIQVTAPEDCRAAAPARGTLIDNNDIYVTAAKRASCAGGVADPTGDCACAENGIDLKSSAGSDPSHWTRITGNRLWGFRPTSLPSCGGSGSRGQALTAGNLCPAHVVVERNLILDSASGVVAAGSAWRIRGNLIQGIRSVVGGKGGTGMGLVVLRNASDVRVHHNTIVDAELGLVALSADVSLGCNAVIESGASRAPEGAAARRSGDDFFYASPTVPGGVIGRSFATADESAHEALCFWRKRWTGPERVCVPYARATDASPHAACARAEERAASEAGPGR